MQRMMTQQLGFSVLTAPVAAIDRRALSQAWYSALHLAHEAKAQLPAAHPALQLPAAVAETAVPPRNAAKRTNVEGATARSLREHRPDGRASEAADRRTSRSPLARKIEHCFLRPGTRAQRATFSIEGASMRVHVSMQRTNRGLRLVAVCPPRVRAAVSRALEEARFALAPRGVSLDARVAE